MNSSTDAKSPIIRNSNSEIMNNDDDDDETNKSTTKYSSLDNNDDKLAKSDDHHNSICNDINDNVKKSISFNTGTSHRANENASNNKEMKLKCEQASHPANASATTKTANNNDDVSSTVDDFSADRDDAKNAAAKTPPSTRHPETQNSINGVEGKKEGLKQDFSSDENKSIDEILALMDTVNKLVKAAQFSPTLGGHIIALYNYLKKHGEMMENLHKAELNQVFVSIRQACCRDAGQLGTPCRLKMMELIELRAMKWRPSLAHSQYYLDRSTKHSTVLPEKPRLSVDYTPEKPEQRQRDKPVPMTAPISAPPYGSGPGGMSVNPFTFNLPGGMNPGDMMHHAGSPMTPISPAPAPSYFLVPAAHASPGGIAFFPTPAQCLLPNAAAAAAAASMMHHNPLAPRFNPPMSMNPMAPGGNLSPMSDFPKGAVIKSSNNLARPVKIPGKNQFRDEVVIRNADSGKIMGVKGRRVSIIEELSGSIISFQKVAQNAKERILTITGPSEESILHAKLLIEDTIRRNVSPDRGTSNGAELPARPEFEPSLTELSSDGNNNVGGKASEAGGDEGSKVTEDASETECALAEMGSILKLSCSDPNVLKVARKALNEYFTRQEISLRRASTGDARSGLSYGKERRKSMPLALHKLENLIEANESGSQTPKSPDESPPDLNFSVAQSKLNARSIPNLNNVHENGKSTRFFNCNGNNDKGAVNQNCTKIVYTRDFLLQCSADCKQVQSPVASTDVDDIVHEVLLSNASMFDAADYKKKFSDFKLQLRA